ncbi:MAG: methylated-DNA--[protein]-cysteine S-methyltransferase [Candidatus Margulisbacteria bacterium]|nr:methylated-DNA--[protein]-cysteine S-methyltransferase [Candidatus Margulisiibacteriota bacterium]
MKNVWKAVIFPIKMKKPTASGKASNPMGYSGGFQIKNILNKKSKYWMGSLFKRDKLYALVLPLFSKNVVKKKLQSMVKQKINYLPKKFFKQSSKIRAYFLGKNFNWYPKVNLENYSIFTKKVLKIVRKIPYGQIRSYSWVAAKAGSPKAGRAVGTILANNRLPLIIPCHRVIKKSGALGQFSAGFGNNLKKIMLDIERKT